MASGVVLKVGTLPLAVRLSTSRLRVCVLATIRLTVTYETLKFKRIRAARSEPFAAVCPPTSSICLKSASVFSISPQRTSYIDAGLLDVMCSCNSVGALYIFFLFFCSFLSFSILGGWNRMKHTTTSVEYIEWHTVQYLRSWIYCWLWNSHGCTLFSWS